MIPARFDKKKFKKLTLTALAVEGFLSFFKEILSNSKVLRLLIISKNIAAKKIQRYFRLVRGRIRVMRKMSDRVKKFFQRVIVRFIMNRNIKKKKKAMRLIVMSLIRKKFENVIYTKLHLLLANIKK